MHSHTAVEFESDRPVNVRMQAKVFPFAADVIVVAVVVTNITNFGFPLKSKFSKII